MAAMRGARGPAQDGAVRRAPAERHAPAEDVRAPLARRGDRERLAGLGGAAVAAPGEAPAGGRAANPRPRRAGAVLQADAQLEQDARAALARHPRAHADAV